MYAYVLIILAAVFLIGSSSFLPISTTSLGTLFMAAFATTSRLLVAYVCAIVVAVPLALVATRSRAFSSVLLPLYDVLESLPILAFFPIIVLFFINANFLEGAASIILFLSMLWNIVFTLVGGLQVIPRDITYAARVFGLRGFRYMYKVLLPSVFPQFVTGSILAFAQGWNLVIVAEAIHAYVPEGGSATDLFGLGSILVQSAASGDHSVFIAALMVMIGFIAFLNLFVWQRLLIYAQRFRFE